MNDIEFKREKSVMDYKEDGFAAFAVGQMLQLFVGLAVLIMVVTLMSTVSGSVYETSEATITAISNGTIEDAIKASVVNIFQAQSTGSDFLGILVITIVGFIAITIVLAGTSGIGGFGGGGSRGSAL
jgi:hypothetical protein